MVRLGPRVRRGRWVFLDCPVLRVLRVQLDPPAQLESPVLLAQRARQAPVAQPAVSGRKGRWVFLDYLAPWVRKGLQVLTALKVLLDRLDKQDQPVRRGLRDRSGL